MPGWKPGFPACRSTVRGGKARCLGKLAMTSSRPDNRLKKLPETWPDNMPETWPDNMPETWPDKHARNVARQNTIPKTTILLLYKKACPRDFLACTSRFNDPSALAVHQRSLALPRPAIWASTSAPTPATSRLRASSPAATPPSSGASTTTTCCSTPTSVHSRATSAARASSATAV